MQSFEQFWNNLDEYAGKEFAELVKQYAIPIASKTIEHILSQEELQIGVGRQGEIQFSLVSIEPGNMDKDLSLRYHKNGSFDLQFSYYDEDGELQEVTQPLAVELITVPAGLATLMKECLDTGNSKAIYPKQLK